MRDLRDGLPMVRIKNSKLSFVTSMVVHFDPLKLFMFVITIAVFVSCCVVKYASCVSYIVKEFF